MTNKSRKWSPESCVSTLQTHSEPKKNILPIAQEPSIVVTQNTTISLLHEYSKTFPSLIRNTRPLAPKHLEPNLRNAAVIHLSPNLAERPLNQIMITRCLPNTADSYQHEPIHPFFLPYCSSEDVSRSHHTHLPRPVRWEGEEQSTWTHNNIGLGRGVNRGTRPNIFSRRNKVQDKAAVEFEVVKSKAAAWTMKT